MILGAQLLALLFMIAGIAVRPNPGPKLLWLALFSQLASTLLLLMPA